MATEYRTLLVKRGSADDWAASTVPLQSGEWGLDQTNQIAKMGDGFNLWPDLPVPLQADAAAQLPDAVRATLAANLGDSSTPEGAALAAIIADSGGGAAPLTYNADTGVYNVPAGSSLKYDSGSGLYSTN